MVVKEIILVGGLGVTAWIILSAFSSRIPNPVEAVEDAGEAIGKAGEAVGESFENAGRGLTELFTAQNDTVTGETPRQKGFFRNIEDSLYGDGSSAARIERDREYFQEIRDRGIAPSGFDTLFGDGAFAAFNNRASAGLRDFFGLDPFMPEQNNAIAAVTTSKNPSGDKSLG